MAIALAATPAIVTSTTGGSLTSAAFTPATGELLVVKAMTEDSSSVLNGVTATGGGITWTARVTDSTTGKTSGGIYTGVVTSGGSSITVSANFNNNTAARRSMVLERWTGAELDVTPVTLSNRGSGAPSASMTTEANNSRISWCNGDWAANAPGTPAYRSSATAEPFHDASTQFYVAYYAYQTAATAGSQTVGMTSPTGQNWNMLGIEIKETSSGITMSPTGIASAEAFGSPTIDDPILISPSGIASAEAFGSVVVSLIVTLSPSGITSEEAFGAPTINSLITLSPGGIASAEAFGTPVHSGIVTLSPSGIASAESFGTPTYAEGITMLPSGISSGEAFGTPTVNLSISLSPTGIVSGEAFGTAEIITDFILNPVGIPSAETFGSVVINTSITLSPFSISTGEAVGTPSVIYATVMLPTGISSGEAFGTPTLNGIIVLSPTGIISGEAFGVPTVPSTAIGIPSAEAFGNPTVNTTVTLSPTGIQSAEAFGFPNGGGLLPLDKPLSEYTYADLEYEFYSRKSGLTAGTINDHKVAFYKNLLGKDGHFDDLEYEYFKSLSGLLGIFALADHKHATIEERTVGDFNDTLLTYYSQFFEGA